MQDYTSEDLVIHKSRNIISNYKLAERRSGVKDESLKENFELIQALKFFFKFLLKNCP